MIEKYKAFDLNLFVVFDALLRHASVSRAAIELGRSQSAISHALARLREHFGDELFIKTHDGVVPTERARELSGAVAAFVGHAEQALVRGGAFDPATSARHITISLTDLGELMVLPPLRARLVREAPNCQLCAVSVWGEELERQLAEGQIDLAISGPLRLSSNVQHEALFSSEWVVLAPLSSPLQDQISRDQLESLRHVGVVPQISDKYTVDGMLDRLGIRREVAISTSHYLSLPYLVAQSDNCIAMVPRQLGEIARAAGTVKLLEPSLALPAVEIRQHWLHNSNRDPFKTWLRQILRDTFAERRTAG